MIGKRGIGIALFSLALTTASVGWAPTAQAHTAQNCTGQEDITYGSGLGLSSETTTVTVDGVYRCTDASGRSITAKYRTKGTTQATCLLFASNKARETLHYADGSKAVIAYESGTSLRILGLNTAKLQGVVVSGRGKGSVAEKVIQTVPASLPTDCVLAGGIRRTIAFTHLSIRPNP
ncbi:MULTISPECIES: hypothetical protein [Streptomyces]|uniref:Secreted protein n=1 Tax=Streptomyces lasiicapitis TaxID=1923961 RepID=A0ABQ2MWQ6_9ACTN|nr:MULTISPECIES: hypothetical protein [Streptomyces]QIB47826.1 hypothetical protein G3H79_36905 [Streptomyces aureoverticillatus]GGO59511.1 hypothetical protein GCM10012286_81280 [Streptomyces lasiicapitis]